MLAMGQNPENTEFWLNNRRRNFDRTKIASNTNRMIRNPSSDRVSRKRMRTTRSSADDHEIIRRSHKSQGITGFADTIKRAMDPREQPQADIKGEVCGEAFGTPSTRPEPLAEYVNGYQSTSSSSTPSDSQPQTSDDEMTTPASLEFRAPGDIAEEPISKDAFSWYVTDFNKDDWEDIPNGMTLGGRASCCGILALSRAFKEQYPNEPYGYQDPEELLNIYDQVTPNYRENVNASDQEMQALVDSLTGGSFALVVAQFQSSDFTERARRIGSDEEQEKCRKNLYLRHIPGHWEPMRRIR
ncbi:hypothetical protein HYALB_00002280 [Hymenoscyphus albidus]|uniref:Uncharacterized protein n=1 Tax=Hymenoscyphus albidus TaxID=595503 RepID=A0A9N9Q793_9HELO|nr:hypothetical protein HYALB_00002280 [Hymenoscyphus albidus]